MFFSKVLLLFGKIKNIIKIHEICISFVDFLYFRSRNKNHTIMSSQAIQQTIANYFKTQPVLKAWLFGSFARGEETPLSDVDIIVLLDRSEPIGLKFFGMWSDLEKLLDRSVDLVEEGELLPFAVENANRDKKLIYERTA